MRVVSDEKAEETTSGWEELPVELMLCVLEHLSPRDLGRMALVCKRQRALLLDESLWRKLCFREFGVVVKTAGMDESTALQYRGVSSRRLCLKESAWKRQFCGLWESPRLRLPRPCPHYKRSVFIKAPCCGRWTCCRFCHDAEENHRMDRFGTKEMLCHFCRTVQVAAAQCVNRCDPNPGYFCAVCMIWDGPSASIYHCDDCGFCYQGSIDVAMHCFGCRSDLPSWGMPNHRCHKDQTLDPCGVCNEERPLVARSRSNLEMLPCAHAVHGPCYNKLQAEQKPCPICQHPLSGPANLAVPQQPHRPVLRRPKP